MTSEDMIREEDRMEEEPLTVAADSLVNFPRRVSPLYRKDEDRDGLVEAEVARMAQLCMTEAAG